MSCCWVGCTLVLPKEPNFRAAGKALEDVKAYLTPLIAAVEAAAEGDKEEQYDVLLSTVEDLLVNSDDAEYLDERGIRMLIADAEDALRDAEAQWPPWHSDGDFVYVGDKIVVFAGDSTYGDSPEGDGYQMLKGLNMFKAVLEAL